MVLNPKRCLQENICKTKSMRKGKSEKNDLDSEGGEWWIKITSELNWKTSQKGKNQQNSLLDPLGSFFDLASVPQLQQRASRHSLRFFLRTVRWDGTSKIKWEHNIYRKRILISKSIWVSILSSQVLPSLNGGNVKCSLSGWASWWLHPQDWTSWILMPWKNSCPQRELLTWRIQ